MEAIKRGGLACNCLFPSRRVLFSWAGRDKVVGLDMSSPLSFV